MSPDDSGDDPNIAPYPGRYEIARTKGTAPNEEPVRLDITGTYDLDQQVHRIAELLASEPMLDGGVSVDAGTRTVVVRLVGSTPELVRLKSTVFGCGRGLDRGVQVGAVLAGRAPAVG